MTDKQKGNLSDGYHTFNELYEHRIQLFITLCKVLHYDVDVWRSQLHSDGTEMKGWFILGIDKRKNYQITYHLPMSKWDETNFAQLLYRAPEWDGHTSNNVLARLQLLNP